MVPAEGAPLEQGGHNIRLISNSEVQAFKRCRRKWALGYVSGFSPKSRPISGPLPFGTAIHHALERYYGHGEDPVAWWIANQVPVYDLENKAEEKDARLGRVMLEGYLEWVEETGIDSTMEVICAEEFVTVPFANINGVEVHLTGRLDLKVLDHRTDERTFLDHKTCQGLEPDALRSEQLLNYDLIDMLRNGGKMTLAGGTLNRLKKVLRTDRANPPFYSREPEVHTVDDLRRYWSRLYQTVTDMLNFEQRVRTAEHLDLMAYPTQDRSCTWSCDFLQCCRMMDDGARWQDYLADEYTLEPSDYTLRNRRDWISATA